MAQGRYWLQTLGCPKNQVDSDKLAGALRADGLQEASAPGEADLLVVNTCAFIEEARRESVETVLDLHAERRPGARLVVTGCLAERSGGELAEAMPEIDQVAGFGAPITGVPVALGPPRAGDRGRAEDHPGPESFDLLELPRPAHRSPWAYVKVAEGCDRICGFCAIPSFRGRQRSRSPRQVLAEVETLVRGDGTGPPVREIVLVAQDLASYGRDRSDRHRGPSGGRGPGAAAPIVSLVRSVSQLVERTRLLYLYPSGLTDELVEAVLETGVAYFDLSLQHVSRPLLVNMRRWGDGERFLQRIAEIRRAAPTATFRSSFILGYPGEREDDHEALLEFLGEAQLDWAGFFPFSPEDGTHAVTLADQVAPELALERLRESAELQDSITAARRDGLVGSRLEVLVDAPGVARSEHEAPEIDGVVHVPGDLPVGATVLVEITRALGPDLHGVPLTSSSTPIGAGTGAGVGAGLRGARRP